MEKTEIISNMAANEVFATFDWGQKVLLQEHREGQSTYFGKSGMSLLVGSFVWKDSDLVWPASTNAATASTTSTQPLFRTQSQISTITSATQT